MKNKCLKCGERIPNCKCLNMNIEEAKDILANSIDDDVVSFYCTRNKKRLCNDYCEKADEDCIYTQAIDTVINELEKKDKIIDEMAELIVRKTGSRIEICHNMNCDKTIEKECKYCAKEYFYKRVEEC